MYSDGGFIHPNDPALATASWACSDTRGRVWGGAVPGKQTAQAGEVYAALAAATLTQGRLQR